MQVTLTSECKELYQKIYSLAYVIGTYSKPQVALLNGITMGGGAAISIPGTFRVATEKTRLPLIEEQLGKLITDEPSVIESSLAKFGDIVHPDRMSVLQSSSCLSCVGLKHLINVSAMRQWRKSLILW
uniref:3-hydroxyisobutyryl-CoA hydrolase n=1 Tax=Nicotiana tabacum TaxID=4097 RepID=A0A1S3WYP5_TOBAC|nr:PREDICTED: 3-hydroxyisobutyryl-CoA hydrolase-like protein 2, mitochondrial isoform X1 [Nicotiana tabacum]